MNSKRERSKERTKHILSLIGAGLLVSVVTVAPGTVYLLEPIVKKLNQKGRKKLYPSQVRTVLRHLQQQRMIEIVEKEGKSYLSLTEKGRKRLIEYDIEKMEIKVPQRWDNKWRMIAFDIPETHKKGRDAFRVEIKRLGFYQVQKSLFAYPYPCRNELDYVCEFYDVRPFIQYFEMRVDRVLDYKLRHHFRLLLRNSGIA